MTDEDRKLLTEWLGECWHEESKTYEGTCRFCKGIFHNNRTFIDPADFFAVRDRLVELGKWGKFEGSLPPHFHTNEEGGFIPYAVWLTSKIEDGTYRLCELVGEWLKEKGKKDE